MRPSARGWGMGPGGMLFTVAFVFKKPSSGSSNHEYFIDMICFSEGPMPVGASPLDLPAPVSNAYCALGALVSNLSQHARCGPRRSLCRPLCCYRY